MKNNDSSHSLESLDTSLPEFTVINGPIITLVDVNLDTKSDIIWIEQELNVINEGLAYIYYASDYVVFKTSGEVIKESLYFTGTYQYLEKGLTKMAHWIGIGSFTEDSDDFKNISIPLSPIYVRCYSNYTKIGPGIDGGQEIITIFNSNPISNLTSDHGHVSQSAFKLKEELTSGRSVGDKYQWDVCFEKKSESMPFYLGLGLCHYFNRNGSILIEYSNQIF
jgi:hypothetical protein